MTTGIKLKLLREKRKLSQEELAYKIGVVQATIGNWERGKSIKVDYIPKLADILEVSSTYFMEESQPIINDSITDAIVNKETGFEITIKTPNTLFDALNKKMDFIINQFNGVL
ncbi:helix-turn-helix transcriptional regulator [Flavobacterium sp.]|uniref:helix-turn-helix domain-containing protein n=1 Tax=Flavobacterium sp. TaxID=239 RepID=UPI0025F73E3D|nr:helix-turn-helix transcriptional regulator [Flavobacterium sp.]